MSLTFPYTLRGIAHYQGKRALLKYLLPWKAWRLYRAVRDNRRAWAGLVAATRPHGGDSTHTKGEE